MRFVLQHPNETRPSILVEVVAAIDADVLRRVRNAMLAIGCANALVIDGNVVRVLRDTFSEMGAAAIEEEAQLASERLLGREGALEDRVRRWLESMSRSWNETLPREDWASPLFYDVVPATSGSVIQRIEPDAA